jgi:clan AA aspartic protease
MMTGKVSRLHALVPVVFRRLNGRDLAIEFVVDTGFTDQLTLPRNAVEALGLPLLALVPADLADGSTIEMGMYGATILWDGTEREVRVLATGQRPLLGTALLDGYDLCVQFREGGRVSIKGLAEQDAQEAVGKQ